MSKKLPKIKTDLSRIKEYEKLLIISPIWFGKIAKPVLPVIAYAKESNILYDLRTLRGGLGDDSESIMASISNISGNLPEHFYDYHIVDYANSNETDVRKIHIRDNDIDEISLKFQQQYNLG